MMFRKAIVTAALTGMVPTIQAPHPSGYNRPNYDKPPFQSSMQDVCYFCGGSGFNQYSGTAPAQIWYWANPNSQLNDAALMQKYAWPETASDVQAGKFPLTSLQGWEDVWELSLPASDFPLEEQNDPYDYRQRPVEQLDTQPDFNGWASWVQHNTQYQNVAYDGGTVPADSYRKWNSQYGNIIYDTPLDPVDCPTDMQNGCTWGDLIAWRLGQLGNLVHVQGVTLADQYDGLPSRPGNTQGFNERRIVNFARNYGYQAPLLTSGWSIAQQAQWIDQNAFPQWLDYGAIAWGKFFGAVAHRFAASQDGNVAPMVVDQCSANPAELRLSFIDQRLQLMSAKPSEVYCGWDEIMIAGSLAEGQRAGPIASPVSGKIQGPVLASARTPDFRNGETIEADDSFYWQAIGFFYPTLSTSDQQEIGYKLLKQIWMQEAWAAIVTNHGRVRRAVAFWSRDYYDIGTLTNPALGPLQTLIQTIRPAAPFGPALYYSVNIEREFETAAQPYTYQNQYWPETYLADTDIQPILDGTVNGNQTAGAPIGLYVSDSAISTVSAAAGNLPSAWLVILKGRAAMPPGDLQALQATGAPIVYDLPSLLALPNQPIAFSTGLSGSAFYDQDNRLTVRVVNPNPAAGALAVTGTITLTGLPPAEQYKVEDLFTGAVIDLPGDGGVVTIPITVARWDATALRVTPMKRG